MNLFRFFNREQQQSAPAARERLQILLAHERASVGGDSDLVSKLRDEILKVIQKHMKIDGDKVNVTMERGDQMSTLAVDIEIPLNARKKAA
jgi:cell division topological specificity factor